MTWPTVEDIDACFPTGQVRVHLLREVLEAFAEGSSGEIDDGDLAAAVAAAQASATASATSATSAATSGTAASTAKTAAESARDLAEAAQDLAVDAQEAAEAESVSAQQASDLALRYAGDPLGVEVSPGVESAMASALRAASLISSIAGVPVTACGSSDYTLLATDLFGLLLRTAAGCTKIILSRNIHTAAAANGKDSVAPVMVYNDHASDLTIEGSATSAATAVEILGSWQGAPIKQDTQPAASTTSILNITVPAGSDRKVMVVGTDINNLDSPTHSLGLTASTGTVTSKLSATGGAGKFSTSPHISIQCWELALTGSAAVDVALTFAIPANCQSFGYRAVAYKAAGTVTVAGGSNTTASATPTARSVTCPANGAAMAVFSCRNGVCRVTGITGIDNASTSVASGTRTSKDLNLAGAQETNATSTGITATPTLTSAEQSAWVTVAVDPASGATSTVTVKGTLTVPQAKTAQILCHSDGTTYYCAVMA
jgi:hypothetical protein